MVGALDAARELAGVELAGTELAGLELAGVELTARDEATLEVTVVVRPKKRIASAALTGRL